MSTSRLACLAVLASTSIASAQTMVATDVAPERPTPRRLEGRIAMMLGGSDVGDADGFSLGFASSLGYRFGELTLLARFDYYRTGDAPMETLARNGRAARIGGAVRYELTGTGDPDPSAKGFAVGFWGEVGAGLEHVAWRRGGVLDRPSGEVALGVDLDFLGKADRRARRRHVGYFMDVRSLIGQGPELDEPATCGGPCSRATRPSRLDVSVFFELGLHWGR